MTFLTLKLVFGPKTVLLTRKPGFFYLNTGFLLMNLNSRHFSKTTLYEEHESRNNVLNGLITSPEERNYSDDEQYFQAILPFFIYCDQVWGENLDVIDTFKTGIEQVWKYAKKDGSSALQGRSSCQDANFLRRKTDFFTDLILENPKICKKTPKTLRI